MNPDFEVRNLAEYSAKDLDDLWFAVMAAKVDMHNDLKLSDEKKKALDVWCYRIKDALIQARKRESEKRQLNKLTHEKRNQRNRIPGL